MKTKSGDYQNIVKGLKEGRIKRFGNYYLIDNRVYPVREITVIFEGSYHDYIIAPDTLGETIWDNDSGKIKSTEYEKIDNEVYYYLEDDKFFNFTGDKICKEGHLDVKAGEMTFISEVQDFFTDGLINKIREVK